MEAYGEEMFNGLACPPLDDFAFNFVSDDAAMNLDADIFFNDDQIEGEEVGDIPIRLKQPSPRKGKDLRRLVQVLKPSQDQLNWIAKCLKEDDQEAEAADDDDDDDDPIDNKKINIKPIKTAERKGEIDAVTKINQIKGQEEYCDKKVLDESSIQLKFESTKRKLHDSYQRIEEVKKQKRIQLIEFQIPTPKPKPKPKPKAMMSSMKKNCVGGKKCYNFHHSIAIPQY